MNKEEKNFGSFLIFIIIIVLIIVGGYFLINNKKKEVNVNNNSNEQTKNNIKIDENKDYIYFSNEKLLSDELELKYKDINININSNDAKKLQDDLNANMNNIRDKVVKASNMDLNIPKEIIVDDIYSAEMIDYNYNITTKYLSLEVNSYKYVVEERASNAVLSYYVFDLDNGKLLSNHDILSNEKISEQDIRSKIRREISNDENVDIDATLNGEYELSFDKSGKLVINTIVKTSEGNYTVNIVY